MITVVFEVWSIDQLAFNSGGPRDPKILIKHNELTDAFADFRILFYEDGVEDLSDGVHKGQGARSQ